MMARVLIEDRLPKWVFLIIAIVVTFLLVDGVYYFTQNDPTPATIGKFNDVKMDEKIDNDADRGISSSDNG